jgi:hypothetical protein
MPHSSDTTDALLLALQRKYPLPSASPFSALDFIHAVGSPLDALMYSRLLWPSFIEVEGMVFLSDAVEDVEDLARVKRVLAHYKGDKKSTQLDMNRYEIAEMFGRRTGDTTAQEDECLARIMATTWTAKLQTEFPRRIQVKVEISDGAGAAIVFWAET